MEWMTLALKKYAQFNGRSRRKEYWMFFLLQIIIFVIAQIIDNIIFGRPILYFVAALALIVPAIAVGIRRMHDTDHSGWWILVPIVNLVFFCTEGTRGPNRFGEDPKSPGNADVFA